jgi:hypothetical protein
MLRPDQIDRIAAAIGKGYTLMAGDAVTAVMNPTEMILNGAFESIAGWDTDLGWTYSGVNKNVAHDTTAPGNTSALEYVPMTVNAGATYEVTFTVSGMTAGTVTPAVGDTPGAAMAFAGESAQEITAANTHCLEFIPTLAFDGAIDSVSCVMARQTLLTVEYDFPTGNKFSEGLEIDNAGSRLHDARELSFLSTYLDAQGVDIHEVDYWLINGERWDFISEAPIQTHLVPIAGIHNIIGVSVRKAVELEQTISSNEGFTFE